MVNEQDSTSGTHVDKLTGATLGDPEAQDAVEATKVGEEAPALEAEPEQPAPKTILEEEHNRIIESLKGGYKGTVQKMRGEIDTLTTRLTELESQRSELEYTNWLRAVEEKGGDVDFAKSVVDMDKKVKQATSELTKKQQMLAQQEAELNEAAVGKYAYDLMKEHQLGEEVFEQLVNTAADKTAVEGRLAMENLALKLVSKVQRAQATPQVSTDKAGGKPAPIDLSKLSDSEKMGKALELFEQGRR